MYIKNWNDAGSETCEIIQLIISAFESTSFSAIEHLGFERYDWKQFMHIYMNYMIIRTTLFSEINRHHISVHFLMHFSHDKTLQLRWRNTCFFFEKLIFSLVLILKLLCFLNKNFSLTLRQTLIFLQDPIRF